MIARMLIMLALFAAVAGGLGYYKYQQIQAAIAMGQSFQPPPEAVTSVVAKEESWETTCQAIGSFTPVRGVTVSAELGGKIVQIAFESGQEVKEGDLLAQLDVGVEEAQLKAAEARTELAKINVDRLRVLENKRAASTSELDQAESTFKQAQAEADGLRATIGRKTIRAPFAGRTGIRQIQLGQYLSAGDPVVTLQTLDPIYVDFSLPQQQLARLKRDQIVRVNIDAFPGRTFEGRITAINPDVDNTTRSVHVQATLANADHSLRPGMFAKVDVLIGQPETLVTLPATAVNRAPYGNSVFIIETMANPKGGEYLGVRQQFVKLGPARGDQVAIIEGVKPGEQVASSGLFKLRPNAEVLVNNKITPQNKAQPTPADS